MIVQKVDAGRAVVAFSSEDCKWIADMLAQVVRGETVPSMADSVEKQDTDYMVLEGLASNFALLDALMGAFSNTPLNSPFDVDGANHED